MTPKGAIGLAMILGLSGAASVASNEPREAKCDGAPIAAVYNSLGTSSGKGWSCRTADRSGWATAHPAGAPCRRSSDCEPACCACAVAGRSALTSWCRDGVCATPEQACCALLGTPTGSCGDRR